MRISPEQQPSVPSGNHYASLRNAAVQPERFDKQLEQLSHGTDDPAIDRFAALRDASAVVDSMPMPDDATMRAALEAIVVPRERLRASTQGDIPWMDDEHASSARSFQQLRQAVIDAGPSAAIEGDASLSLATAEKGNLQETFRDFVGQTFFGQMIASMRATQQDVPYFNGGRAEKVFQGQLDQVLAEELSDASASQFADPMFRLFQLQRK